MENSMVVATIRDVVLPSMHNNIAPNYRGFLFVGCVGDFEVEYWL